MLRYSLVLLLLGSSTAAPLFNEALAQNLLGCNSYMRLGAGLSIPGKLAPRDYHNEAPKEAGLLEAALGYHVNPQLSWEIAGEYRTDFKFSTSYTSALNKKATSITQEITSHSLRLNGYYDLVKGQTTIPYLTAGLGVAHNKTGPRRITQSYAKNQSYTRHEGKAVNSFTWNVGAGIRTRLSEKTQLSLGYRYVDLGHIESGKRAAHSHLGLAPDLRRNKTPLRAQEVVFGLTRDF